VHLLEFLLKLQGYLSPEIGGSMFLKCWCVPTNPSGVTMQKTSLNIFTDMRTSYLEYLPMILCIFLLLLVLSVTTSSHCSQELVWPIVGL
jgi:surface polysaccharide O-acyltransferase-like enzyme